jgi:hypothetical protein
MSVLTQEQGRISTDKLLTRENNFLQFVTQAPLSKFKELIVTSPKLPRGLHSRSMLKTVPDGLKARGCERIKLRKPPPVPYVPMKDEVQDEVARMQSMEIKTKLEKDTTLNFAVWQENGLAKLF